jgi:excisionase family DNA binding protein
VDAVSECGVTGRDRLLASLSPELVDAIEQLITDRVQAALETQGRGSSSPWLSLEEAAAYLRVSERTLERQLARGRLRSTTLGRRRLLHRDRLDEFAKSGDEGGVTPATPPRRRARTLDPAREEA